VDTPMKLRAICGHDSRSVDGCTHCEAADLIEGLRARERLADRTIRECQAALAEELSALDLILPLPHVKQAHDRCAAWFEAGLQRRPR
jgi:hypothetical protein